MSEASTSISTRQRQARLSNIHKARLARREDRNIQKVYTSIKKRNTRAMAPKFNSTVHKAQDDLLKETSFLSCWAREDAFIPSPTDGTPAVSGERGFRVHCVGILADNRTEKLVELLLSKRIMEKLAILQSPPALDTLKKPKLSENYSRFIERRTGSAMPGYKDGKSIVGKLALPAGVIPDVESCMPDDQWKAPSQMTAQSFKRFLSNDAQPPFAPPFTA
eukprot:950851_1